MLKDLNCIRRADFRRNLLNGICSAGVLLFYPSLRISSAGKFPLKSLLYTTLGRIRFIGRSTAQGFMKAVRLDGVPSRRPYIADNRLVANNPHCKVRVSCNRKMTDCCLLGCHLSQRGVEAVDNSSCGQPRRESQAVLQDEKPSQRHHDKHTCTSDMRSLGYTSLPCVMEVLFQI